MSGFESYSIYNALLLHYNSDSYNAYKYHFKTRVSRASFEKRRDRYFFEKLGRKYDSDSLKKFYTANIIKEVKWVGSMTESNYKELQSRLDSVSYRFKTDIKLLTDAEESFDKLCRCENGNNLIIDYLCSEKISIETVSILDQMVNFINDTLPILNDPLSFKKGQAMLAQKYKYSLVDINMKKMKDIVIKEFTF
jgi:hypothetical protein